jgi:hypothetical protein
VIFTHLPELFFAPLASPNRRHYAALLLVYYRLFLEYHHGVERELVVDRFASYFASLDSPDAGGEILVPEDGSRTTQAGETDALEAEEGPADGPMRDPRGLATHVLRRLIAYGWMDEEEQLDFTRLVTIKSYARPFFEALDATDRGAAVEYESHIVAVYSSLVGDSAREHGEHAVLNAHYHTRMLIESLKVLEQNIRGHVQALFDHDQSIPEILRSHYDVYMHEVVDRAYTRLKTSDNLSRYRPRIARSIGGFLKDETWLDQSAGRLAAIQRIDAATARERVRSMLIEIRDDLASIDPILESIDDRNRRYSRISTERIRAQLHADTSLQGRIAAIIGAIADGRLAPDPGGEGDASMHRAHPPGVAIKLHRLRFVADESLYVARSREVTAEALARPVFNPDEEAILARELEMRAAGQLNPSRVAAFLGSRCRRPGDSVWAHDLVEGIDGYIRVLYAASYAERPSGTFPYEVEWGDDRVEADGFSLPAHRFIRRHDRG